MSVPCIKIPVTATARAGYARAVLVTLLFLLAGLASCNATAGILDKLLAPAVGTKEGFSEGKKTYDEDTLKPEELKSCVIKAHDLDAGSATWASQTAALNKERDELNQMSAAIMATIEDSKKHPLPQDEMDKLKADTADYKEKEAIFNRHVRESNAKAKDFAKEHNAAIDAFSDACAGKRFYKSDLNTVRPNLPFDITDILEGKK